MEFSHQLVTDEEFDALNISIEEQKPSRSGKDEKFPAKLHARKVAKELNVSKGLIYLPGEPSRQYEDSDQSPPFRQRRYFFYIAGADFPDCSVTYDIGSDHLTLWIPFTEPRQILWFGKTPTTSTALQLYDVDDVRYTTQLDRFLHQNLTSSTPFYTLKASHVPQILYNHPSVAHINVIQLRGAMDQARVVKSDYEVRMIRRANDVSSAAHRKVAENFLSLTNERDIEAIHLAVCTARGTNAQAYPIIAGAGTNGATLHYFANNTPLAGKETIVVDAGCEWNCYASDITRTFPIPGTWSPRPARIHKLVERMQDACISRIQPGVIFFQLHLLAMDIAMKGLLELGILKGEEKQVAEAGTIAAFFPHGLGHHVGLEVHDVSGYERLMLMAETGSRLDGGKRRLITPNMLSSMSGISKMTASKPPYSGRQELQPNMIVTVEPGIYFCREYIEGYYLSNPEQSKFIDKDVLEQYYEVGGVRIEDCILVTEDGYENLTTAPKGDELLDIINHSFEHL